MRNNNYSIYSGFDAVSIDRIDRAIAESDQFKKGVFNSEEIRYCESKKHPSQHFAGRWCIKEAFMKMGYELGHTHRINFKNVTVGNGGGSPKLLISNSASFKLENILPTDDSDYNTSISISHDLSIGVAIGICMMVTY